MVTSLPIPVSEALSKKYSRKQIATIAKSVEKQLALSGVDMGRATHYATREELDQARNTTHAEMFALDRSLYGCSLCFPGVTDISKQTGVLNMLSNPWEGTSVLTPDHERMIIDHLVSTMQPNRMIKLFASFPEYGINNARARKTILPFILNSNNLEWWAVKYKQKLRTALNHCWGQKMTSAIKRILGKKRRTAKEKDILSAYIGEYLVKPVSTKKSKDVLECISFILGVKGTYTLTLFKKFNAAKKDFKEAQGLPKEVIEGIRSTYHPDVKKDELLAVAEKSMTQKERKLSQAQATRSGAKDIKWNPFSQPLVDLFLYVYRMGKMDVDVRKAIGTKAKNAGQALPFRYPKVGIILDNSFSASGSAEQKLRPLAVSESLVEMLKYTATDKCFVETVSGGNVGSRPKGETNLASPLIRLLKQDVDVIFVISDGYENAPEGRFAEVLKIAQDKLDITVPVYHFNPVAAAESKTALRQLSDKIPVTPVSNPEAMGLTLFKTMLSTDPHGGLLEMVRMTLPVIEKTKLLPARSNIAIDAKEV